VDFARPQTLRAHHYGFDLIIARNNPHSLQVGKQEALGPVVGVTDKVSALFFLTAYVTSCHG
jgi:hypothetical protein